MRGEGSFGKHALVFRARSLPLLNQRLPTSWTSAELALVKKLQRIPLQPPRINQNPHPDMLACQVEYPDDDVYAFRSL
jgi:hypothetical protein